MLRQFIICICWTCFSQWPSQHYSKNYGTHQSDKQWMPCLAPALSSISTST